MLMALGKCLLALKDYAQAKHYLRQSRNILKHRLKYEPHNTRLLNVLGRVLTGLQEYDEAETILKKSLDISSVGQKQSAHRFLGQLYEAMGLFELAISEWNKALEYTPNYSPVLREIESARRKLLAE